MSGPSKVLLGQDIVETVLSFPRLCSFHKNFSLVVQSCPTLRSHGLQHARLPYPSPTSRAYSNSCPLSRWCHSTISSSVVPFSSCLQSFPALGYFPMSQFFVSGGQSIGASNVWHSVFLLWLHLCNFSYQSWAYKCRQLVCRWWLFIGIKMLTRIWEQENIFKWMVLNGLIHQATPLLSKKESEQLLPLLRLRNDPKIGAPMGRIHFICLH